MWMESALGLCLGSKIHGVRVRRGGRDGDSVSEVCAGEAALAYIVDAIHMLADEYASWWRCIASIRTAACGITVPACQRYSRLSEDCSTTHRRDSLPRRGAC
jgi:hypothetical protein